MERSPFEGMEMGGASSEEFDASMRSLPIEAKKDYETARSVRIDLVLAFLSWAFVIASFAAHAMASSFDWAIGFEMAEFDLEKSSRLFAMAATMFSILVSLTSLYRFYQWHRSHSSLHKRLKGLEQLERLEDLRLLEALLRRRLSSGENKDSTEKEKGASE